MDGGCERMTHRILLSTLVIDAPVEVRDRTVEFWAAALGAERHRDADAAVPHPPRRGRRPTGWSSRASTPARPASTSTSTPTTSRPRCSGSTEAAAPSVVESWADHPGSWVVMRDPNGMEFCVVWALNPRRPQADRDDFEARAKEIG